MTQKQIRALAIEVLKCSEGWYIESDTSYTDKEPLVQAIIKVLEKRLAAQSN